MNLNKQTYENVATFSKRVVLTWALSTWHPRFCRKPLFGFLEVGGDGAEKAKLPICTEIQK